MNDTINQDFQLRQLRQLTGLRFQFVPAGQSPYHVKAYSVPVQSAQQAQSLISSLAANDISAVFNPTNNTLNVVENEIEAQRLTLAIDGNNPNVIFVPIGEINGNPVYLTPLPSEQGPASIVVVARRAFAIVNVNGKLLPFYVSSGLAGKEAKYGIASGQWYPLLGLGDTWFNKMPNMKHNPAPELDQIAQMLNSKFPAAEFKERALRDDIPWADQSDINKIANQEFPEGVIDRLIQYGDSYYLPEDQQALYDKNANVYLPNTIEKLRRGPSNYLEIYNGPLAIEDDKNLRELQKEIPVRMVVNGGHVQFIPNRQYPDANAVRDMLSQRGINVGPDLSARFNDVLHSGVVYPELDVGPVAAEIDYGVKTVRPQHTPVTIEQSDIERLYNLLDAPVSVATSPTLSGGSNMFYYFFPDGPANVAPLQELLNGKYNLPTQRHSSSLHPDNDIIRIALNGNEDVTCPQLRPLVERTNSYMVDRDVQALSNMMSSFTRAISDNTVNGTHDFLYYIPQNPDYIDAAIFLMNKYGIICDTHLSSLNNKQCPIIRVPLFDNSYSKTPYLYEIQQKLRAASDAKKKNGFEAGRQNISQKSTWQKLKNILNGGINNK